MKPLKEYIFLLVEKEISKIGVKDKILDIPSNSDVGDKIAPDVADIVKKSYSNIGGFPGADTPSGVKQRFTHFNVADVDDDPEPDTAVLYTDWGGSKKASAVGTDGSPEAKDYLKKQLVDLLNRPNTWIEVSGAPSNILVKKLGLSTINDPERVQKLLPDFEIEWHGKHPDPNINYGNGWFTRKVAGKPKTMIIVGNPPTK